MDGLRVTLDILLGDGGEVLDDREAGGGEAAWDRVIRVNLTGAFLMVPS
jgi:NAD(P)-dependent dehydrogenase (short-subunit alcohol dehydrogenase family)